MAESAAPADKSGEGVWYYELGSGEALGPVSWEKIVELVSKEELASSSNVWSPSHPTWTPVRTLMDGKGGERSQNPQPGAGATPEAPWFYLDAEGTQQGPLSTTALQSLSAAGYVTGETLVWRDGWDAWKQMQSERTLSSNGLEDKEEDTTSRRSRKRERPASSNNEKHWIQPKVNTWVYVTGLPPDVTVEEVEQHFRKCGLVMCDPTTKEPRIKLYRDEEGNLKGDGSVCYLQADSVSLAMDILDGDPLREPSDPVAAAAWEPGQDPPKDPSEKQRLGWPLHVQPAVFERKEGVKRQKRNKEEEQVARVRLLEQRTQLSWDDGGDASTGLRIVLLKNMFDPNDLKEPGVLDRLREDVASQCELLGDIDKITVFVEHPAGVVQVKFKDSAAAAACIERMHGRYYAKRKITCEFWDGVTDYRKKENKEDEEKRIEEFGKWLEEQDPEEGERGFQQ